MDCLRQREGEYTSEKLTEIRNQGGSDIFVMLTSVKCRAAEAWVREVLLPAGEKPWGIEPTPIPDLDPSVKFNISRQIIEEQQVAVNRGFAPMSESEMDRRAEEIESEIMAKVCDAAKKRAEGMEMRIADELEEGGFRESLDHFISDFVTFPTAFLKGPVDRNTKKLEWRDGVPVVVPKVHMEFDWVSPFDIYPSPSSRDLQGGYVIERIRLTRAALNKLIGVPGYNDENIRKVLSLYGDTGLTNWMITDQERAELEGRDQERLDPEGTIEVLEFWGSVPGRWLSDWGMNDQRIDDLDRDYEITALLVEDFVIRAVLNPHPLGHRPYYYASFERVNGSVWGKALPELMKDIQGVCNACARAMVNNMAIASGPQVEVNIDRLPAGEDITQLSPWKIHQTTSDPIGGRMGPAIQFYQPNAMTDQLLKLFDYFYNMASEVTGIPPYAYGSGSSGGSASTASGLSMLMNASSRVMRRIVGNIDVGVIVPAIRSLYSWLMLYAEDSSIKGDVDIRARASDYLLVIEQLQMRRNEFLQLALQPAIANIIGEQGLTELLREIIRSLKMPSDSILPSQREMDDKRREQEAMAQQAMAMQAQQGNPAPFSIQKELDVSGQPPSGMDYRMFDQMRTG
jgi:hypothetical protein